VRDQDPDYGPHIGDNLCSNVDIQSSVYTRHPPMRIRIFYFLFYAPFVSK
jgi:hypothetical protein